MKILVLVKETLATDVKVDVDRAGKVKISEPEYIVNPFDEFAIEEALRIKEKHGGEVVLLSVGRLEDAYALRSGIAMGADQAMLMESSKKDSKSVSKLVKKLIDHVGDFDIVLSGWVSYDDASAQVPGRVSELLDIPLVNLVTKMRVNPDVNTATCSREADLMMEKVEVKLPAMFALQRGINIPRLPTVQNIMNIKYTEIDFYKDDLIDEARKVELSYGYPIVYREKIIVRGNDVDGTVERLIGEMKKAKVL